MSDSPACEIEIVIPWDDADLLEALRSIQVREAAGWNFTGAVEGTTVLLTLTPVILGSLVWKVHGMILPATSFREVARGVIPERRHSVATAANRCHAVKRIVRESHFPAARALSGQIVGADRSSVYP
jgi:hypothetical protein